MGRRDPSWAARITTARPSSHCLGVIDCTGIVHADVKSDNFLVERRAGRDHVTMIDFGLARFASSSGVEVEDGEAIVSGTPEYMAPEVVSGGLPVAASDLYGAGVILYELLTGTTPFGGGSAVSMMVRHAHDVPVPPSQRRPDRNIPAALDRVVTRALEKQPEARFHSAAEFAQAVRAAVGGSRPLPDVARRSSGAHSDSATHNTHVSRPRRRIARGSDCGAERHLTATCKAGMNDSHDRRRSSERASALPSW